MRSRTAAALFLGLCIAVPCMAVETGTAVADSLFSRELYGTGTSSPVLNFYQKYISPLKGGNTCPMHPSCSQYAKMAMEHDAPFSGVADVCDRLVRCGRDLDMYMVTLADGMLRAYDPPELPVQSQPVTPVPAADSDEHDTASCTRFADHLFNRRQYLPAMLEYERQGYLSTDITCRRAATFGVLSVSFEIEPTDRFTTAFYRLIDSLHADAELYARSGLMLAQRYYRDHRYTDALSALNYYVAGASGQNDERLRLASLCMLSNGAYETAVRIADSITIDGKYSGFRNRVAAVDKKFFRIDRSPGIAALFSALVPGAGYLYAGYPQTASASLFVNGLLMYTAYECFTRKLYGAGSAAAMLSAGFYFGNIRGSAKAAWKGNGRRRERRIRELLGDEKIEAP